MNSTDSFSSSDEDAPEEETHVKKRNTASKTDDQDAFEELMNNPKFHELVLEVIGHDTSLHQPEFRKQKGESMSEKVLQKVKR